MPSSVSDEESGLVSGLRSHCQNHADVEQCLFDPAQLKLERSVPVLLIGHSVNEAFAVEVGSL